MTRRRNSSSANSITRANGIISQPATSWNTMWAKLLRDDSYKAPVREIRATLAANQDREPCGQGEEGHQHAQAVARLDDAQPVFAQYDRVPFRNGRHP